LHENKVLTGEGIAEIDYEPLKCSRPYRLIIVRKNISVQKGERVLFKASIVTYLPPFKKFRG
jgi:hypothetical protein